MKLSDFDYNLEPDRIAQTPAKPRDKARLLIVRKNNNKFEHTIFRNIVDYLEPNDVLVLNDSKVIPARLIGKKETGLPRRSSGVAQGGGKVEVLLLEKLKAKNNLAIWQAIGKGKNLGKNTTIIFSSNFKAVVEDYQDGLITLKFNCGGKMFHNHLERFGIMPLPPYIKSLSKTLDKKNYQTVYADNSHEGSVAAPTAGLHFTPSLLKTIRKKGIKIEKVTLHVGLGTFRPITTDNILDHKMHAEWASVSSKTINDILKAKKKGGRIFAVGTTSIRVLESAILKSGVKKNGWQGFTNIFIYPPYKFKLVDGLITNFHLPKSTLLLLVSALAGTKTIKQAYQEAIKKDYRFYSYGDAMLIL